MAKLKGFWSKHQDTRKLNSPTTELLVENKKKIPAQQLFSIISGFFWDRKAIIGHKRRIILTLNHFGVEQQWQQKWSFRQSIKP